MNGTPVIVLLLASLPIIIGLVGIWYPFRPRRFERLLYARWQRVDSRRVEMAVTWPIGFLSAFVGAWLLYDVMDSGHQPKWPMLAAFCAIWVWSKLSIARARRLPDPTSPPEAEGGKQSTARPSHSTPDDAELADETFRHPLSQHSGTWWLQRVLIVGAIVVGGLIVLPGVLFAIVLVVATVVSLIKGEAPTM